MFSPRIKMKHLPERLGGDVVGIGGKVPGIAERISDPRGWVRALLETLDGTRTVDQVVAELVHRFPEISAAAVCHEVVKDVGTLMTMGFVENAAELAPTRLSEREQERYSRNRELARWMARTYFRSSWDVQLLLRQARVVVVGVGGTGSNAALSLAQSGVGEVHVVDPDVVELSNLARQGLYLEQDVGRPKVEAAVQRLRERNSDIHITGESLMVTGPAMLLGLAAQFDVVVLAADQPRGEIRSWTKLACHATGTAWVHSGYHGPQINYGLYRPGTGPCCDCVDLADLDECADLPAPIPIQVREPGRIQASNAQSAGVSGHLAANAVMSLITGVPDLRINCEYGFNIFTGEGHELTTLDTPRPDCPTCGPQPRTA